MNPNRSLPIVFCFLLASCATSHIPVFAPLASGGLAIDNEIEVFRAAAPANYKIRSRGISQGELKKDIHPVVWEKIETLKSNQFTINLFAKQIESTFVRAFLNLPPDQTDFFSGKNKLEALTKIIEQTEFFFREIYGDRVAKSDINLYIASYDTQVVTPVSDWQFGPTINPVRLNLAMMLPPLGPNFEREEGFDDQRFFSELIRTFSHEYAHVIHSNAPTQFTTILADEFLAHSIDRCVGYSIYAFMDPRLNQQLLENAAQFSAGDIGTLYKPPFATSTVGGKLAIFSFATFFARPDVVGLSAAGKTRLIPTYCKRVIDMKPRFSTAEQGVIWIREHIGL